MKWVKHDTDANQDARLQNVLLDYGLEGYGLYWYCIELIAGKVDQDNITFELEHDARIIARNTGSTPQKVEEMMRYFVESGLFENTDGVITCLKIAKRLDKSMTSNSEMRALIGRIRSHDSVMTESAKPMKEEKRLEEIRVDKEKSSAKRSDRVPYQKIVEAYQSEIKPPFKQVKTITDKRKRLLSKLYKELGSNLDDCQKYFEHFNNVAGEFYRGENNRGWIADFDYIVRVDTLIKAREGSL